MSCKVNIRLNPVKTNLTYLAKMLDGMRISPANRIEGAIHLPADKSISHRAAIIAAMANGTSTIENFSTAEDCHTTLKALRDVGINIEEADGFVTIHGAGKRGFSRPSHAIDCGNSGTTMRLLAGVLAGQPFGSVLTGDASLRKRPMRRIVEPLQAMGALLEADNDRPPISITASNRLRGLEHRFDIASAQVKSCILLAGLNADGITVVHEPVPTRDHTERMLEWFGEPVSRHQRGISVAGDSVLTARHVSVPADVSAAAFFLVAAAMLPGSNIGLPDVGINSTRTAIFEVLRKAGLQIDLNNERLVSNEDVGDLHIVSGSAGKSGVSLDGAMVASLIDEIPILAVLGTSIEGGLEVHNATELRYKESDRIAAIVDNLGRMNARVEEFPDGFRVMKSNLKGAEIDSRGDHRIAMAFSIAALVADGETKIRDADCVVISFPQFFETLKGVVR